MTPLTVALTAPLAATHADLATFIDCAAAEISISRAAAPAVATGVNCSMIAVLPPVRYETAGSASDCRTVIAVHGTRSSSARICASPVIEP